MRTSPFFALLALAAFVVSLRGQADDDTKKEFEKLQGTWKLLTVEKLGEKAEPKGITWVVKGNKLSMMEGGKAKTEGTVTLNAAKTPHWIDLAYSSGAFKSGKHAGIYELNGDDLRICWFPTPGGPRPTQLKADPTV